MNIFFNEQCFRNDVDSTIIIIFNSGKMFFIEMISGRWIIFFRSRQILTNFKFQRPKKIVFEKISDDQWNPVQPGFN